MTNVARRRMAAKANQIFQNIENMNAHLANLHFPPVATMEDAIRIIERLYLNIVDFVNGKIRKFRNYQALRHYTISTRKFYRKEDAKAEGLQHLLIKLF